MHVWWNVVMTLRSSQRVAQSPTIHARTATAATIKRCFRGDSFTISLCLVMSHLFLPFSAVFHGCPWFSLIFYRFLSYAAAVSLPYDIIEQYSADDIVCDRWLQSSQPMLEAIYYIRTSRNWCTLTDRHHLPHVVVASQVQWSQRVRHDEHRVLNETAYCDTSRRSDDIKEPNSRGWYFSAFVGTPAWALQTCGPATPSGHGRTCARLCFRRGDKTKTQCTQIAKYPQWEFQQRKSSEVCRWWAMLDVCACV